MDLPPGPSCKGVSNLKQVLTDEELINILENSDEDFDCSSESDLGEGDSADEDCDPEFNENLNAQNQTIDNDAVFRIRPIERH